MWSDTIILSVILIQANGYAVVHFFVNNTETNWSSSKRSCALVGPGDILNTTKNMDRLSWIDATVSFTPWTLYRGSFIFNDDFQYTVNTIDKKNPILSCFKMCSDSRYFGLQESQGTICACFTFDGEKIESPINAKSNANSKLCNDDTLAICARENVDTDKNFAVYEIVEDIKNGTNDCLSTLKKGNYFVYKDTPCSSKLNSFCPTDKNPVYCIAGQVRADGIIQTFVKKCGDRLPSICKVQNIDVKEKDMTGYNDNNSLIVAVLLLVVFLVIGSIIITLIVRLRKRAQRSFQAASLGQGDVYAVVQKRPGNCCNVDESRTSATSPPSEAENPPGNLSPSYTETESRINSSPFEDVYDHTDHTLRPQINEENNYDSMACVNNEYKELVYNTTNETTPFNIIAEEDESEYSHVGNIDE